MFQFERGDRTKVAYRRKPMEPAVRSMIERAFANKPEPKDFAGGLYGQEEVEADLALLEDRIARNSRPETQKDIELKELADIFEALVLLGVEKAEWMGKSVKASPTSDYDNSINKVDMVLEFRTGNESSHLGIVADVTFSSKREVIAEKFDYIRKKIKEGVLTEVKYYHSDITNSDAHLTELPEVVIGVSGRVVRELEDLATEGNYQALSEHWAVVRILQQMRAQLYSGGGYALRMGKKDLARIYSGRLAIIDRILEAKKDLLEKVGSRGEDDPVHMEIMNFAENWSRY
ncbi:hypothetical protein A2911_02810 [Candidatus Nomurabacteria bacterium RIFCSPLOWO2_01_FULL_40_15]|uniref:Uncharacterized protein n=1 Tax=Candidatus Nomurabacteria bacterium RIFCSPLOWO2_01_FULL_40_15 TaxID=1801772 RepID=A0A1F6X8J0_9BACT|nr:MAG: hypothetical protein A2911_02810 [Candidatus Nomurabacteria bacterium RIFCSPLOWO2_01_FULL_40_15]